ncbi:Hint domain-containing protein [Amylibacter sp.]|nr:Hint domain-containing protein [Amylibacter sp.]
MPIDQSMPLTVENVSVYDPAVRPTEPKKLTQRPQSASSILAGTPITTDKGDLPVEFLRPGDFVLTKDESFVPLRGIGTYSVSRWDLVRQPELRPIVFPIGSIGNETELRFCGMHRVYLTSVFADMIFGTPDILAPARSCVGNRGIYEDGRKKPPQYYQLLFDRHELICSAGAWTESLFLGDVPNQAHEHPRNWIMANDFDVAQILHTETARMTLDQRESRVLFNKMNGVNDA